MQKTSSLYVSTLLTNTSLAYRNEDYIAELVFPVVTVKKESAKIASYGTDNLRIEDSEKAPGSKTNEVEHTVTIGDHYTLIKHALKEIVPDEHMEQADKPINPKIDATENITDRLKVEREKALADWVTNTSNISQNSTLSGINQWSDYDNSDPIGDIATGVTSIRSGSGKFANTLILAWDVFQKLKDHPDLVDRIKYVKAAGKKAVADAMAAIFEVDQVLVGKAQYETAKEGSTSSLAEVWTKDAVLAYIEKKPTLKSRSLGFTYRKSKSMITESWRDDDREGDWIRVKEWYDQKAVDEKCAYLIQAAIA